jgi:predicted RNA-binding Zn ribbon-like protein
VADWLWEGGRPSVDFLNTLRNRELGGHETLRSPAELAGWFRTAQLSEERIEVGAADLTTARRLRDAIDGAVFTALRGDPIAADDIAVINTAASMASLAPMLAVDDRGRPRAEVDGSAAAALARVAIDAIALLTGDELTQLRICAAPDCGVRFVDRSPARNRQWCSMRRCGNRSKARRHYARHRDSE